MKTKKIDVVREALRTLGSQASLEEIRNHIVNLEGEDRIGRELKNLVSKERSKVVLLSNTLHNNKNKTLPLHSDSESWSLSVPIPKSIFTKAINLYGETWGRVACLILSFVSDDEDSLPPLPAPWLASCHPYGFSALRNGKRPNEKLTAEVIEAYENGQCPFDLMISSYKQGDFCRSAEVWNLDSSLYEVNLADDELVDVFTGLPYPKRDLLKEASASPVQEVEKLRQSLNAQEIDYSPFFQQSKDSAKTFIENIEDEGKRQKQATIFKSVVLDPKPIYSSTKKTARLYTVGPSLQFISSGLREIIFFNQSQFDLTHAQLSMIKTLWGIDTLDTYLKDDFWNRFMAESGCTNKPALKQLLYAVMYGSPAQMCKKRLMSEHGLSLQQATKAICCPLIHLLFNARANVYKEVFNTKSVKDAFGQELLSGPLCSASVRSALAAQAQSYEILFLMPVVAFLQEKGFPILLWLHDGLITSHEAYQFFPQLHDLVKKAGEDVGIEATLHHEFLGKVK